MTSGGLLLLYPLPGFRVEGLGPGRLLEIGEQPVVVGTDRECQVVVSGVAIGPRCFQVKRRDGEWLLDHVGGVPLRVGTEFVNAGRRPLAQGDLVLPLVQGDKVFFAFVRFDPAARRSALYPILEAAVQSAFPDRADSILAETSRWFPDEVLARPEGHVGMPDCAFCGAWAAEITALHPASFDFVPDTHVEPPVSVHLCHACIADSPERRLERAEGAEMILAEVQRALAATGAPSAGLEVERRFHRARVRWVTGTCAMCLLPEAAGKPVLQAGRVTVCRECLQHSIARWA